MSEHPSVISNAGSLWEDEDMDDDTFLQNSRVANGGGERSRLEQIHAKREEIEQRTLASTNRSLGLLHETEQCGIATAEELAKQREKLEKTNENLQEITKTLNISQRHLNGLKSVFGGLKNYLAGRNQAPPPPSERAPAVTSPKESAPKAFGDQSGMASSPTDNSYNSHPVARLRGDVQTTIEKPAASTFDQKLEANLDMMAGNLSRLKGLAIDLHTDIDSQNTLIDSITNKAEGVDITIQRQNRDMNRLLGKK